MPRAQLWSQEPRTPQGLLLPGGALFGHEVDATKKIPYTVVDATNSCRRPLAGRLSVVLTIRS
jgi:hypothetical protein